VKTGHRHATLPNLCQAEYHSFPRASIHVPVRLHSIRPSMLVYVRDRIRFKSEGFAAVRLICQKIGQEKIFMARGDIAAQLGINGSKSPTSKLKIQNPRQLARTLKVLHASYRRF
jgi:hypothetical protein